MSVSESSIIVSRQHFWQWVQRIALPKDRAGLKSDVF
ncbi:MAG: hypothetical protein A4E31_00174 [Methanomassiliicoccales archaeon PtaU1.Bin030]|nr:MAG: hypothetical protein A4E31_00174 [Methanomassiliicoccales archaeon PtaU1.Bin030]